MLRFPMLCQAHCKGDDKVSKGYAKQNTNEILWETNGNPRGPALPEFAFKGNDWKRALPGAAWRLRWESPSLGGNPQIWPRARHARA